MQRDRKESGTRYVMTLALVGLVGCSSVPRIVQDGEYDPAYLARVAGRASAERSIAGGAGAYPPTTEVVSPEELRLIQRAEMEALGTAEHGFLDDFLRAFGLAPERSYQEVASDRRGELLAGYYDPRVKRLTLVERDLADSTLGWISSRTRRDIEGELIVSHELVHALQDQRWDLAVRNKELYERGDSEQSLAFRALVEGDAELAGLRSVFGTLLPEDELRELVGDWMRSLGEPREDLRGLERWMFELGSFPYSAGGSFVQQLHETGGWEAVNAAYERPPATSEQILHPDKYHQAEGALAIATPDVGDQEGWYPDMVMGELATRAMLASLGLDAAAAERAAAGWGGDALRVSKPGDPDAPAALVWETAWDSPADADEFAGAWGRLEGFVVTRQAPDRGRIDRRTGSPVQVAAR